MTTAKVPDPAHGDADDTVDSGPDSGVDLAPTPVTVRHQPSGAVPLDSVGPLDVSAAVRATLEQSGHAVPTPTQRYTELRELGRGGMGRVSEARDGWLGRRVAVKRMHDRVRSATLQRRFELEALITAQLDHPGIPTVYERCVGEDGRPFLTMRLIEGTPLSRLLREAPSAEARLALLPALVGVAQTLAFAHERGVIHRDIKPDNVIVGAHGEAVLLDWGIAKVRGLTDQDAAEAVTAPEGEGLTAHGAVLGTPAYMAPEQARGDSDAVDERADVFALGAMLFHLLAGHAPYRGATMTELLAQARAGQPPSIDAAAPQAPAGLRAIVQRAMSPERNVRHANAGEFTRDLGAFMVAAVTRPPSAGVERFIAATSWFGLVMCVLVAIAGWLATPTIREMGVGAAATLVFFVVGLAVAVVEWRSAGRHRLAPIGLGLTALTAISGVAGAVVGLLYVYRALAQPDIAGDAARFRSLAADGHYEALGNVPFGLTLALLLGMVLAFAHRRAALARGPASER